MKVVSYLEMNRSTNISDVEHFSSVTWNSNTVSCFMVRTPHQFLFNFDFRAFYKPDTPFGHFQIYYYTIGLCLKMQARIAQTASIGSLSAVFAKFCLRLVPKNHPFLLKKLRSS